MRRFHLTCRCQRETACHPEQGRFLNLLLVSVGENVWPVFVGSVGKDGSLCPLLSQGQRRTGDQLSSLNNQGYDELLLIQHPFTLVNKSFYGLGWFHPSNECHKRAACTFRKCPLLSLYLRWHHAEASRWRRIFSGGKFWPLKRKG